MTQQAYEYFLRFSTDYFQKVFANHKSYRDLEPVDFLHDSFAETNSYLDLKKVICRKIYSEYYSYLGKIQHFGMPITQSKFCKTCQKVKDYSKFHITLDKRYNFRYCVSKCKECTKKMTHSEEFKKKKRAYQKNEDIRHKRNLQAKKTLKNAQEWWTQLDIQQKNSLLSELNFKKANQMTILKMWAFERKR